MRKIFFLYLIVSLNGTIVCGQELDRNKPPVLTQSTKIMDGKLKTIYTIKCYFSEAVDTAQVKNIDNWQVRGESNTYILKEIDLSFNKKSCVLIGNWDIYDDLSVNFNNQAELSVITKDALDKTTLWGFGKGKALDLNLSRIANQKSFYAFEYDFKIRAVEYSLSLAAGNISLHSLSLNVTSNGAIASDDTVRNGTQNSVGLAINPYFFVSGLIYRSELDFSYMLETKMNMAKDNLFDIIDKKLKLGAEIEIPLTNYPIYKLHSVTGYARLAMPLTIRLDYLFGGESKNGFENLDRLDFKSIYELAFSPYLIVQGEWHRTQFLDAPAGFDKTATYYSLAIAQDLNVVKKNLGFLEYFLGPESDTGGKNFIFFRISKGRKAPAFIDVDEKAIGFGTYF